MGKLLTPSFYSEAVELTEKGAAAMDKRRILERIVRDEGGATAIEYGLICAMIVLAMLAALRGVAQANTSMWNDVSEQVAPTTP